MKKLLITILTTFLTLSIQAQTSVAFNHLGNTTFQNRLLNPAIIPEGRIFFGLPVMSGVHLHLNNKLSYNEIFTKEAGQQRIDIDKVLDKLQKQNMLSMHANVNLFHFGLKTRSGVLFTFSANERIEADALYSKDLVNYLWNGNSAYTNEEIKVSDAGLKASHFREFALGIAMPLTDQLTAGVRGKFLVGFLDMSTPGNFKANLESNGEAFQVSANWENASLRTSGLDIYQGEEGSLGSHLIMNGNTGFALDLGATYKLNRYYTVTASLLDVGFIKWKENIVSEVLSDTTFTYSGVALDAISDVQQIVEDSLLSNFETTQNNDPYTSWLPLKAYGSWIYHFSKNTDIYVTVGTRLIQRQLKMMYGGGVTQKFGKSFTASISATKLPQQFFNAGAALAVTGGPVRFYLAADQLINFSVPDMKSLDFRFGMSFAIKAKQETRSRSSGRTAIDGPGGTDTYSFLGSKVKTKKREGIYSIIKKQKRRELKDKKTKKESGVQTKSLGGRKGKKNVNGKEE